MAMGVKISTSASIDRVMSKKGWGLDVDFG